MSSLVFGTGCSARHGWLWPLLRRLLALWRWLRLCTMLIVTVGRFRSLCRLHVLKTRVWYISGFPAEPIETFSIASHSYVLSHQPYNNMWPWGLYYPLAPNVLLWSVSSPLPTSCDHFHWLWWRVCCFEGCCNMYPQKFRIWTIASIPLLGEDSNFKMFKFTYCFGTTVLLATSS